MSKHRVMFCFLVLFASVLEAGPLWVTDFNDDLTQPPAGYRHNVAVYTQEITINVRFDTGGDTVDLQASLNGGPYTSGFSQYWDDVAGTGSMSASLPYACGKVTVRVKRSGTNHSYPFTPFTHYSNPVEIYVYNGPQCLPRHNYCSLSNSGQAAGKPCDVVTGRLWYQASDLVLSGPFGLTFTRWYDNQSIYNGDLGYGWRHSYSASLVLAGNGLIQALSPEGLRTDFNGLSPGASVHDMATGSDLALSGDGSTYTLTTWDKVAYAFDSAGRLLSITDRIGNVQTVARDGSNRIQTVSDPLGRSLTFTYDGSNRIATITTSPGSLQLLFAYTGTNCGSGNLCSATMPDSQSWHYEYTDVGPHNLTKVLDPLGHAEESNTYAGSKLASQSTEGNQNTLAFSYPSGTTTTVTDGLSRTTTYTNDPKLLLVNRIEGPGCGCGGGEVREFKYDAFLRGTEEWVGGDTSRKTTWVYGRDQTINHGGFTEVVAAYPSPTSKTEPLSPSINRATQWGYPSTSDSCRDLVTTETLASVDSPGNNRTTTLHYSTDGKCLLLSRDDQGYVGGVATTYTTTYTYDSSGRGRVATVNGPRTDANDITTYEYFPDGDTDPARRGQLKRVTDPVGSITTYAQASAPHDTYDLYGNPLSVTDPNGVVATMA